MWDAPTPDQKFNGSPWRPASWVYQLQHVDVLLMGKCRADVKVIDWTKDGRTPWSRADVFAMRNPGEKILAYVSIGEAEDYRSYWAPSWLEHPTWLGDENPEWKGNYKVQFWDPAWRRIAATMLQNAIRSGFNGAYLDIIDAYEYWQERGIKDADARMIEFVIWMTEGCRSVNPDFLIVPQNGAGLLQYSRYVATIDAIAREDMLYGEENDGEPNAAGRRQENLTELQPMRLAGKPILAVEYGVPPKHQPALASELRAAGAVPYFTTRPLDTLTEPLK